MSSPPVSFKVAIVFLQCLHTTQSRPLPPDARSSNVSLIAAGNTIGISNTILSATIGPSKGIVNILTSDPEHDTVLLPTRTQSKIFLADSQNPPIKLSPLNSQVLQGNVLPGKIEYKNGNIYSWQRVGAIEAENNSPNRLLYGLLNAGDKIKKLQTATSSHDIFESAKRRDGPSASSSSVSTESSVEGETEGSPNPRGKRQHPRGGISYAGVNSGDYNTFIDPKPLHTAPLVESDGRPPHGYRTLYDSTDSPTSKIMYANKKGGGCKLLNDEAFKAALAPLTLANHQLGKNKLYLTNLVKGMNREEDMKLALETQDRKRRRRWHHLCKSSRCDATSEPVSEDKSLGRTTHRIQPRRLHVPPILTPYMKFILEKAINLNTTYHNPGEFSWPPKLIKLTEKIYGAEYKKEHEVQGTTALPPGVVGPVNFQVEEE